MYYVYLIVDPIKSQPFYVGKGTKDRAYSHLKGKSSSKRVQDKITSLRNKGVEPTIIIHTQNLTSDAAYKLEKKLIREYGRKGIDDKGILMNLCKDNRPPTRRFQKLSTREKISCSMKGKNSGKVPWNKGISHKRGPQTKEQTLKIMSTRTINLIYKILEHYEIIDDDNIQKCKKQGFISKNSPISESSIVHFLGQNIKNKEDIDHYTCCGLL